MRKLIALLILLGILIVPTYAGNGNFDVQNAVQTHYAFANTVKCEIKRVSGVAAGGVPGTDTVIAAVPNKIIRLMSLQLIATATTSNEVYLTNGDNNLLGNSGNGIVLDGDGIDGPVGFIMPWNSGGWIDTDTRNEAVVLNTSAAQDIVYVITYIEVP